MLSAEVEIIVQEFLIPEHCKEHSYVPSHGSNEKHCWSSKSLFPGICSLFPTSLYYFVTLSIFHSFVRGLSGSMHWDFSPSPAAAEQPCPEQPAGTSSSWAHSMPRCQRGSCTRSTTVGQLEEGNAAHTYLPRQLFVLISEHKPQTPGNKWHGLCTCLRHKHSVVKFLTVVSIYHMVFANPQLINIKCFVKAFVESCLEVL